MSGGCDCIELCAMGPTCPGAILGGVPGAGCWRDSEGVVSETDEATQHLIDTVRKHTAWSEEKVRDTILSALDRLNAATSQPPEDEGERRGAVCEDAFCSDCQSLMVEDDGAGHLCPACDEHPASECGTKFPCSGFDGKPCVLNSPLMPDRAAVEG